jgi:hypothetical protein
VFAIKPGAPVAFDDYSPLIERLRNEGKKETTKEDLPELKLVTELEQEEEETRAAEARAVEPEAASSDN